MATNPQRQLDELGVFVHGVLAGLHLLSLMYNLRRKNWLDVSVHSAAAAYDIYAVGKHHKRVREIDHAS